MRAFIIAGSASAARELCAGARTVADEVVLCIAGALAVTGVADRCLHIEVPANRVVDDAYLSLNAAFDAVGAGLVFAETGSLQSLSLVGRLAAHLGVAAMTGVMELDGDKASSLYFGGTGVRTVRTSGEVVIYTVPSGIFDGSAATGTDVVEEVAFVTPAAPIVKLSEEPLPVSSVDLNAADVIIACGRGFAEEDELGLARGLASKIGAEVGCTRPLTEAVQWFPREAYVGVSGQAVAPRVYIAVGISGQMQHMVGCNRSTTIVAVNKDGNAPIFKQCDVGIVGDLKTVLPALAREL